MQTLSKIPRELKSYMLSEQSKFQKVPTQKAKFFPALILRLRFFVQYYILVKTKTIDNNEITLTFIISSCTCRGSKKTNAFLIQIFCERTMVPCVQQDTVNYTGYIKKHSLSIRPYTL